LSIHKDRQTLSGAQLHSRYNPQAEAARYIDSLDLDSAIECFILIEPGLGYMIPILQEKFRESKIIALHIEGCPGTDPLNVQKFLENEVPQEASRIRIIEWRPSLNFYKEEYLKLLSLTVDFIKQTGAEKRTVAAFGKKWVGNFFRNLENLNLTLLYKTMELPVIITGSGPSLEAALPLIQRAQEKSLIIAASSSITALAHNGIKPDIIIATDGGSWALKHIYPYFRNSNFCAGLAVNLCAALPSQTGALPHLIINDGSLWQSIILRGLSLPSVIVGQKGTVSASAVELAMILSGGNIYFAGMDLSVRDIRTHARPYEFDHLLFNSASRLTPVYSKSFIRSRQMQSGGSLDIYAAWFEKQFELWPKRIFPIEQMPKDLTKVKNTSGYFKAVPAKDNPAGYRKKAADALLAALKDSKYTEELKTELSPLLSPNEKEIAMFIQEAAFE
jgi:hypothetical protein